MEQQWWKSEEYSNNEPVPPQFADLAGPHGVAVVRAWADGRTDPGWGFADNGNGHFMDKYRRGAFRELPIINGYKMDRWNFAFVMRSMKMICIDIDGKNGGLEQENIGKLGQLKYTLAETSKSGNGYHLFYKTSADMWDRTQGYAMFGDRIGIAPGVDIRATGCVFHHPPQRWNNREIVELSDHMKALLTEHIQTVEAQVQEIMDLLNDPDKKEDLAMKRQSLIDSLDKKIPAGRRNQTLYAIGNQMQEIQVANWEKLVTDRAIKDGLDVKETLKLIANIKKYGGT